MGRNYHGFGSAAVGVNKTILTLIGAATIKPRIYQIKIGCAAAPGDQATDFRVQQFTAVGTEGGGFTPCPLDPGDSASVCDCGVGVFAVEPTYTANKVLDQISLNQQATFLWVATLGAEYVIPAVANSGIGIKSASATGVAAHEVSIHWTE